MTFYRSETVIKEHINKVHEHIRKSSDTSTIALLERAIIVAKDKTHPIEKRLGTLKKALGLVRDD